MQAPLENALAALTLGPELDFADPRAVAAFLERHGVQGEDAEALAQGGLEQLLVYRRLIQSTLREAIELALPRSIARLGPLFDEYFARFLAEQGPRTHYLRDVTREFLDACEPAWRSDPRVPAYLPDLARHESLRIEIGAAPARPPAGEIGELELERGVVFDESCRVVSYAFAVHELGEDEAARDEPAERLCYLLVYRSPEHEVRYLELTPLCAEILQRLLSGSALRSAVLGGCDASGVAPEAAVIEGTARVLADLAERGALLGSAQC